MNSLAPDGQQGLGPTAAPIRHWDFTSYRGKFASRRVECLEHWRGESGRHGN